MLNLTKEQVGRMLVGSRVEISIGEPWDFTSADGDNLLRGQITEVRYPEDLAGGEEVHLKVTPFTSREGLRVERLIATRRYAEEVTIVEHLAAGEDAEANFGYAPEVPQRGQDSKGSPFLIGGFSLEHTP